MKTQCGDRRAAAPAFLHREHSVQSPSVLEGTSGLKLDWKMHQGLKSPTGFIHAHVSTSLSSFFTAAGVILAAARDTMKC